MIKIVTGGQSGVDTGALRASERFGIPWHAFFPLGWRRETARPTWMHQSAYGQLHELSSASYSDRTSYVVRRSSALLVIAPNLTSPGTRLTMNRAKAMNMPRFWYEPVDTFPDPIAEQLLSWFHTQAGRGDINFMVAGPRASKWEVGERKAYAIVGWLLSKLREARIDSADVAGHSFGA